jgi:hypothetical protein
VRRFIALADAVNVALGSVAVAALLVRLALTAPHLRVLPFALGALFGFIAADIASGLLHWFCDTYLAVRTPLIGPMLIAPFREHHVDPGALARHGVFERNGNNCLGSLPLLLGALCWLTPSAGAGALHDLGAGFLCALAITLCFTNQIHAWAHSTNVPRAVRWLQRAGVLLAPERHAVHHRGARAYAVVSGWSNAWLDHALAHAENVFAAVGIRPDDPGANS